MGVLDIVRYLGPWSSNLKNIDRQKLICRRDQGHCYIINITQPIDVIETQCSVNMVAFLLGYVITVKWIDFGVNSQLTSCIRVHITCLLEYHELHFTSWMDAFPIDLSLRK
jgi:hypothetical protein